MEEVLDVYARPHDPKRPLVCLDEFCKQLLSETRVPMPARPGTPARQDYEYVRHGSATAFMLYAPLEGRRELFIAETGTRTRRDYALALEFIATRMFPEAETVVLVEDNLNTHDNTSLYEAFEPRKARRLAVRFERHHTPKHGSWLNIAESEIAALLATSMPDRVESLEKFREHCLAGQTRRNDKELKTKWQFTNEQARIKLHSLYPSI
jgi:hypothetical protein